MKTAEKQEKHKYFETCKDCKFKELYVNHWVCNKLVKMNIKRQKNYINGIHKEGMIRKGYCK